MNIHAAPVEVLSAAPPTAAVFPSADSPTDHPCSALPTAPAPTRLAPCGLKTPERGVTPHAAPMSLLSPAAPGRAVLPSAESAPEYWCPGPTSPVPTSFAPCWLHPPPLRVKTQAAPTKLLSAYPS